MLDSTNSAKRPKSIANAIDHSYVTYIVLSADPDKNKPAQEKWKTAEGCTVWERCCLRGAHSQMNEPVGGIKTRREGNGDRR